MVDQRGRIVIDLFSTLDGVQQAPGGPEEDPSSDFTFGGWQAPVTDDVVGRDVVRGMDGMDALLLGRRTYEIFAAYWPQHAEGPIGGLFASIPKYVVSRGTPALSWADSSQLGADTLVEVDRLRDRHRNIHVIGSIDFARTLFDAQLFDQLTMWVFPVVLGKGKRLFHDGTVPANLRLIAPPVTAEKGAVLLRYAPAGTPTVGVMGEG